MEVWQKIVGFDGYEVSDKCRVKRLSNTSENVYYYHTDGKRRKHKRTSKMNEKILKPQGKRGLVNLYKNGAYFRFTTERLMNFHFND